MLSNINYMHMWLHLYKLFIEASDEEIEQHLVTMETEA